MEADEKYIPRSEFDLFANQQRESYQRIEASLTIISEKIDNMNHCVSDRVTWEAHDRFKKECQEEFKRLHGRPSWAVAIIVGFLSTAMFSLLTLVLARMI